MGGDYGQDPAFRQAFSQWIHQLWQEKDLQIAALQALQGPQN
jgi:hypothetical protein